MKHGSSNRRQRNRGAQGSQGRRGNNQRNQIFDSNGPDVRIRGTANQVAEKYRALAKDAASSGDRSLEENYLQHAEHYQRVINAWDLDVQTRRNAAQAKEQNMKKEEFSSTSASSEDDLSLPASILTPPPKVDEGATATEPQARTSELAD